MGAAGFWRVHRACVRRAGAAFLRFGKIVAAGAVAGAPGRAGNAPARRAFGKSGVVKFCFRLAIVSRHTKRDLVILRPSDEVRFLDSGGTHLETARTGLHQPEMGEESQIRNPVHTYVEVLRPAKCAVLRMTTF